ncbi:uncharacterized protein TRUGW13939_09896 [Talaromyces rugulosus]|uniref:Uncharacterized protein n=1 Tax=Talaromyces rugulosus TaxID=121627 RepID=A0A7H8R8J9_TALRU|nr:uncharacterized protein TRUGW13939_09896 [Talaromyces rugulosus]QKX62734.1 hypothetical protein TRUGW13939_09896 [Talaromyces rugulosus]
MVYYIRFLKPPKVQDGKNGLVSVSTLISITTDLGDAFLAEDVSLHAQLLALDTNTVIQGKAVSWQAGKRELLVSIGPVRLSLTKQSIILAIGEKTVCVDELGDCTTTPLVISGCSAAFGGPQGTTAAKLVERRFALRSDSQLRIWEETGNNIARHIWDAALAAVICLRNTINNEAAGMQQLQNRIKNGGKKAVRAVELGAGCGIFGIALAQMLPRCAVTLTDLPEVDEIVSRNIQAARLAPGSALDFQVLDWDEKPSDDVFGEAVDLVLVSDCTYNADSLPALVRVLGYLTNVSPHALVLVSLKRRHESEAVFFELMQEASFAILEQTGVSLPAPYSETDSIEMYAFGRT